MFTLVFVGLLGGLITSLSPCVLPVLPVVLGGEGVNKARPYAVIAGLVLSFSVATLFGSVVLSALGLPQDLLRDAGIAVLRARRHRPGRAGGRPPAREAVRPAASPAGRAEEQRRRPRAWRSGLLYVPCAGPVLATIAVVGATHRVGFSGGRADLRLCRRCRAAAAAPGGRGGAADPETGHGTGAGAAGCGSAPASP